MCNENEKESAKKYQRSRKENPKFYFSYQSVRGDEMEETHLAITISMFTRERKWNGNDG